MILSRKNGMYFDKINLTKASISQQNILIFLTILKMQCDSNHYKYYICLFINDLNIFLLITILICGRS